MKIAVLIPSEDYRVSAGARIRYGRIGQSLALAGHSLRLEDIGSFDPMTADADVVIISKCHDARAAMCAKVLAARGCVVGVDLFDDYFSQQHDSRMTRYRDWLAGLAPAIDFVLSSTPAMVDVARLYRTDLPIHVMNDPADLMSNDDFTRSLQRKLEAARDSRTIDLCWFGMGDNPHFRIGLSDLAAFGEDLATPLDFGFNVRLSVITNARALDASGLDHLARLPVPVTIEEWTEERETAALAKATACILPVNAQPFSVAKSLNRSVSALGAACQVIAPGYPLYAKLQPLLYRDLRSLAADLDEGRPLLSMESLDTFEVLMKKWASAEQEAARLADFLGEQMEEKRGDASTPDGVRMAVIHGNLTSGATHSLGQRLGALTARSPFCTAKLHCDIYFGGPIGRPKLDMFVNERALDRLLPEYRSRLERAGKIYDKSVWSLSAQADPALVEWSEAPLNFQLAVYAAAIDDIRTQIVEAFGPMATILSESSPHAFTARAA